MSENKKVLMHATVVWNNSGRMDRLLRGYEYELPVQEASDFVKNGMAYIVDGPQPINKMLGTPRKVKENAKPSVSDSPRRKRGRPRGSKNIPKN